MMHCVMGQGRGRTNKPDQAVTPGSQRTAFERSFSAGRAVAERHESAAAVERNCIGLYFPVNSRDEASTRQRGGVLPATGLSGPACISLLIPGTRPLGLPSHCAGADVPERGGLYFSVNSRNDSPGTARLRAVADRCRFRRMLRLPKPDRHCKSLQIVADTHAAVVPSSRTQASLLRKIAAAA